MEQLIRILHGYLKLSSNFFWVLGCPFEDRDIYLIYVTLLKMALNLVFERFLLDNQIEAFECMTINLVHALFMIPIQTTGGFHGFLLALKR